MKWLKRDFIIKISVIAAVLMTTLVSMNLIELLDKYVNVSLAMDGNSQYEHQELKELRYIRKMITDDGHSWSNAEEAEEIERIEGEIKIFIKELPQFTGNITIPLVYMNLNGGVDVSSNVIISFNEKLPFIIEYLSKDTDGIYIGNSYNGYWSGDAVNLNQWHYKVSGIIRSSYLQLDNSVIIPYLCMNDMAKEEFYNNLAVNIFYDKKIPVYFSSNSDNVIDSDMKTMEKYISENNVFSLQNIGDATEEDIEAEKRDTLAIYRIIKQIVCIISALFCFIAIFGTIKLFLNKKKKDITIMWALGSPKTLIFKMLIKELGLAILAGVILAFLFEWIIYGIVLQCRLATVFIYGSYALIVVVIMALLMITVIMNIMLKKCRICEE